MCQAEMEWGMENRREGRIEGRIEGRDEGRDEIMNLVNILISENRLDDIKRVTEDKEYCDKLLEELKITTQ